MNPLIIDMIQVKILSHPLHQIIQPPAEICSIVCLPNESRFWVQMRLPNKQTRAVSVSDCESVCVCARACKRLQSKVKTRTQPHVFGSSNQFTFVLVSFAACLADFFDFVFIFRHAIKIPSVEYASPVEKKVKNRRHTHKHATRCADDSRARK